MNAIYLALGTDYYARFADSSPFPFVRDTWRSLVLPNQGLFITILIVFEATAGGLILSGGRRSQIGLIGLIGFHVGQLAFGGVLWPWAIVMLIALVLLLRAERSPSRTRRVRAVNLMTSPPEEAERVADGVRHPASHTRTSHDLVRLGHQLSFRRSVRRPVGGSATPVSPALARCATTRAGTTSVSSPRGAARAEGTSVTWVSGLGQ